MPKSLSERPNTRPVFISHAASDKELVNFFVDTILIKGIGISHEAIFNTSAVSSPISPGANFTEDIRKAIKEADFIVALITPFYYERAFAMAELGAAWAFGNLIPILVPPLNFENAEGVLKGAQCLKINEKTSLSTLYDRLAIPLPKKRPRLVTTGHATFEEHRDLFLANLPTKLQKKPQTPSAPAKPSTNNHSQDNLTPAQRNKIAIDLERDFTSLLEQLRLALADLPLLVRLAFMHHIHGATPYSPHSETEGLSDAEYRGLITAGPKITNPFSRFTTREIRPSNTSQRNRDVFTHMNNLTTFLKDAPELFHRAYEKHHNHPADLTVFPFWKTHDLLSETISVDDDLR